VTSHMKEFSLLWILSRTRYSYKSNGRWNT